MEMLNIDPSRSSQIAQIGHDGQSLLRVLFRRGGLYEYPTVDVQTFEQFAADPKPGEFFRKHIKDNKQFPFRRVQDSEFKATPTIEAPARRTASEDEAQPAPSVPELESQEVEQVAQKTSLLVQNARSVKVTDAVSQLHASNVLLAIAALRKEVDDTFRPMKEAAFRAHRTICEQHKKHDGPLAEAETAVNQEISRFVAQQRAIAREQEEILRRRERERAEREAREESERRAIEDAEALQAMGDTAAAEAVLSHPAPVPVKYVAPAPIAPSVSAVKGLFESKDWDFRIVNESAIPREYLLVNESAIRTLGRNTKGKAKISGVEFYETTKMKRTGRN